jgi:hypothetical protein
MRYVLLLLVCVFTVGCNSTPEPPEQRLFDTWEVVSRATLATDRQTEGLDRVQINHLLTLLEIGMADHRYEFRRSGDLAFGVDLLKPIAHFKIIQKKRGHLTLELKDVGQGSGRVENAKAWFVGDQLHLQRGTQTLVLAPD